MSKTKDGGPAFPTTREIRDSSGQLCGTESFPGMSLRAWLAGMAMQGICSTLTPERVKEHYDGTLGGKIVAKASVVIADAMIAELEKP